MTTTMLHIKLHQADKAAIQQAAATAGITASAFVINAARQVISDGSLRIDLVPSAALQTVIDTDDADDMVFPADSTDHAAFLDSLM